MTKRIGKVKKNRSCTMFKYYCSNCPMFFDTEKQFMRHYAECESLRLSGVCSLCKKWYEDAWKNPKKKWNLCKECLDMFDEVNK